MVEKGGRPPRAVNVLAVGLRNDLGCDWLSVDGVEKVYSGGELSLRLRDDS